MLHLGYQKAGVEDFFLLSGVRLRYIAIVLGQKSSLVTPSTAENTPKQVISTNFEILFCTPISSSIDIGEIRIDS